MSFWDRFRKQDKPAPAAALSLPAIAARLQAASASSRGVLRADDLDAVSRELGAPREQVYAALAMSETTSLEAQHDLKFVVCTGNCRDRGALLCVQRLLAIRDGRQAAGKSGFDIVPRQCLGRCQVGPAIELATPDGTAVLANATPAMIDQATSELFED